MAQNRTDTDRKRGRTLRPLPVHVALANNVIIRMQAAGEDGNAAVSAMLQGIKIYQDHPFTRPAQDWPVCWRAGGSRLLYCAAQNARAAMVIIPSLINRYHILDMLPDKSFMRFMAARGIDVYALDWGDDLAGDGGLRVMDDVIDRVREAVDAARDHAGDVPLFAAGYCMGGTLLAMALAAGDADLRGALTGTLFLASPWDFHAGDGVLARHIQAGTPAALQMMAVQSGGGRGSFPADWIQSVFAAVNDDRTVHKFARFAAMDHNSAQAQLFVAVEDWLNDGLDLPLDIARCCIRDWYGDNALIRGQGRVHIDMPALLIAPRRDRLVPAESALALARVLPDVTILHPDCGHIGMMTGARAADLAWGPAADWVLRITP